MALTWEGVITNAGNNLLAQWTEGKVLTISKAATGAGRVGSVALMSQTALKEEKQTASIISEETVDNGHKIKLRIEGAEEGYGLAQYGVWAKVDEGPDTLLALFQNNEDIPIPSKSDSPDFKFTFYALLEFDNTGELQVTIDTSTSVTRQEMEEYVSAGLAKKQDVIDVKGLLKGEGKGKIVAAVAGEDYGLPMPKGHGAPTENTKAEVGQHYFDEDTGKEYTCTEVSEDGKTTWEQSGATDASDLTYDGKKLSDVLDGLGTLTGHGEPSEETKGAVGQTYVDLDSGNSYLCTDDGEGSGPYQWLPTGGGGGVKPQVDVTVTAGSAITATCGEKKLTGTAGDDGHYVFDLPAYGTWIFKATLGEQTTAEESVVVDQVKQYTVTLSYFRATLTVTAEEGAEVKAVSGQNTFTGKCTGGATCALEITHSGTYTITATKEGVTSSTATAEVTQDKGQYTATVTFITLTVTIDAGSNLTVSKDAHSYNRPSTSGASTKFYLPETGVWSAKATKDDQTAEGSINCAAYQGYTLELSYVKITGVSWNYSNQNTALTRLKKATDKSNLVNVDISTEPAPAVGNGAGSSPFDTLMPWMGMEMYNIVSNAVGPKKGTDGFNLSTNDVVVYIPEFWFKIEDDSAASTRYFYVADKAKNGFTKHPGSGRYVGRYNTISGNFSRTGAAPLVNITRPAARTGATSKGKGWYLYDFASWCAVWLLYLVEYADWDSQKKIGKGYTDGNSSAISSGQTDSMTYHTGRPTGTDGKTAVQYRWIENPWGNVYEWIDGVNFNDGIVYVCTNPAQYNDNTGSFCCWWRCASPVSRSRSGRPWTGATPGETSPAAG